MTSAEIIKIVVTIIVTSAVSSGITYFVTKLKLLKVFRLAIQSLLRNDIFSYYQYYKKKGYCPIDVKQALEQTYKPYHALGGDDVATQKYKFLMALPDEPKGAENEHQN